MARRTLAAKSLADLESLAREQHWQINRLPGGHYEWKNPAGRIVHVASTPKSNGNSYENVKADLRAAGLICNRAEWRRVQREERTRINQMEHLRERLGRAFTLGGWEPFADALDELDDELVLLFSGFVIGTDEMPSMNMKCPCGKQSAHPKGFITHLGKCPEWNQICTDPTDEGEAGDVKRDLREPPPQEQRIDCPDCGQFYWISQPHLLERHVQEEHGKARCPYCKNWFIVARGGLTKHIRACPSAHIRLVEDHENGTVASVEPNSHEVRINGALPIEVELVVERAEDDDPVVEVEPPVEPEQPSVAEPEEPEEPELLVTPVSSTQVGVAAAEPVPETSSSPAAVPTQTAPLPIVTRHSTMSDADLWSLLEMVLDGPIHINAESFTTINEWMGVTRRLFALKEQG